MILSIVVSLFLFLASIIWSRHSSSRRDKEQAKGWDVLWLAALTFVCLAMFLPLRRSDIV